MKIVHAMAGLGVLVACNVAVKAQSLWEPFGNFTEGAVYDFHVHNGELYLAGRNGWIGTGLGAFVRRWNGTEWLWVGNQLLVERPGANARDLITHNGELYVVGEFADETFQQAARWDGQAWQPVGNGLANRATRGESFDGKLWAVALGTGTYDLKVLHNGQWVDPPSGPLSRVNTLNVVDGQFYVGTWDGQVLRYEAGQFVSEGSLGNGAAGPVVMFNGKLHAGFAGNSAMLHFKRGDVWQRESIAPAGTRSAVRDLEVYNDELFIFGADLFLVLSAEFTRGILRWCPGMRGGEIRPRNVPSSPLEDTRAAIVWQGRLLVGVEPGFSGPVNTVYRRLAPVNPVIEEQPSVVPRVCDVATRTSTLRTSALDIGSIFLDDLTTGLVTPVLLSAGSTHNVPIPPESNGLFRYIVTTNLGKVAGEPFLVQGLDIDFNNNRVFPEDQDVIDFFQSLAGGVCVGSVFAACDSIDINANGVFPEDADVIAFFNRLSGACE